MKTKIVAQLIQQIQDFIQTTENPIIVLLGPTASGKTKLSLLIAKAINGEIISTDSRQIYKGMDIGTDAILPEEQDGVPHHMLRFLDPNEYFSLSDFKYKATGIIKEIYQRKNVPMLVGGTGLYINAIIENYKIPQSEPDFTFRNKLQEEYEQHGAEHLHQKLVKVDPEAAKKIHPNNIRYIIRALEINHSTKSNKKAVKEKSPYKAFYVGLQWPREILYKRVNLRVDLQLKRGLIEEVKGLMETIKNPNAPAFSSLGCKEIIEYLQGNISKEEAIELVKKNTRNYAKRQLTWFRRNKEILWLDGQDTEKELKSL